MTHSITFSDKPQKKLLRILWTTDLHLDAANKDTIQEFFEKIRLSNPDIVLIGGDICNGVSSFSQLEHFYQVIEKPIYFVFGNHDYYFGSIAKSRMKATEFTKLHPSIHYLTNEGVMPLSASTALVGHDGWSDGRAGDFFNSKVMLNDYLHIEELKNIPPFERLQKLNELGTEAADHVRNVLPDALKDYDRVILLTHTPPFEEVCLWEGKPCNADWAPHFVCQALGEALIEVMQNYPQKNLLVLCGHSHASADVNILPNLRVVAGASALGDPDIQGIIEIS